MILNKPLSMIRFGLVSLTWFIVTWNYYKFSHFVHHFHFDFHRGNSSHHHSGEEHGKGGGFPWNSTDYKGNGTDHHSHGGSFHWNSTDHKSDHRHGRGGDFDKIFLSKDGLFLFGLALPILLLTLATLVWNPKSKPKDSSMKEGKVHSALKAVESKKGDVNVQKWTIICFLVPLLLVMLEGALGHSKRSSMEKSMGWDLYIRICMSLMSPSGYAATWALALFLIPVTKHSPILDWMRVTPVQALAFHRVAGWTGLWNSILHGFLHLRHLMDVLNPHHMRPWYAQLKLLLIPETWKCFDTQNPWHVFFGKTDPLDGTTQEAQQCWLALVNSTGVISTLAFIILGITSLPQVRRYSYALFYSVHIPAAWIMLIMAIWHYPTCGLILIPNIIYYLSFHIPVSVTQYVESWRNSKTRSTPITEANCIQGGLIEIVFAAAKSDRNRHESRFVKLSNPSLSAISHPFSVFSPQGLTRSGRRNEENASFETLSIIFRPTGPFTKGIAKVLFPSEVNDDEQRASVEPLIVPSALPQDQTIQFDSYYAGSFDWIDRAVGYHDEILMIAGGVGIVPFLEFLPCLQRRIEADYRTGTDPSVIHAATLTETNPRVGPTQIDLHWYCREVGFASYVWYNHLCEHVEQDWANSPICQGRLKIHIHLTGTSGSPLPADGKDMLKNARNSGLVKKHTFVSDHQLNTMRPVRDAPFTQSRLHGLALPGSVMGIGIFLHWWWYRHFIMNDKYRNDNLVIRSHAILFAIILALVASLIADAYIFYKEKKYGDYIQAPSSEIHSKTQTKIEASTTSHDVLSVHKGRPLIQEVTRDIIVADRPGVYMCGPHRLMESVEKAIGSKRHNCAFYREDSEM